MGVLIASLTVPNLPVWPSVASTAASREMAAHKLQWHRYHSSCRYVWYLVLSTYWRSGISETRLLDTALQWCYALAMRVNPPRMPQGVEHTDWIIEIYPRDKRCPNWEPGCHTIVEGDEDDAVDQLEIVALQIKVAGRVPDGLDWRNQSGASVQRRVSRRRFAVRVDCFEFETESGWSNGHGWLVARPA